MASVIEPPALDDAVAEAKALLRIDGDGEDAMLARLIETATAVAEAFTGQWLMPRQGSEWLQSCSSWRRLNAAPIRAITGLETAPIDGDTVVLAADAYSIDIDANGDGWVQLHDLGTAGRVQASFEAGLASGASWSELPEPLRQGILRLAAHLYSHRDNAEGIDPPAAVTALWRPWRRMRLA